MRPGLGGCPGCGRGGGVGDRGHGPAELRTYGLTDGMGPVALRVDGVAPGPLPGELDLAALAAFATVATRAAVSPALPLLRPLRPSPSLHQLPYEPHEFGGFEGFGEEGVDTDVEAGLDLVLSAGADDGEGKVMGAGVGTEQSGGPQTVEPGHDDIKGDHVGPHLMNDIQTLGTIGRGHDLETLQFEIDPDQLPDDLVVVHNKHPTRRPWHNSRVGPDRPPRPGFPDFRPRGEHPRETRS